MDTFDCSVTWAPATMPGPAEMGGLDAAEVRRIGEHRSPLARASTARAAVLLRLMVAEEVGCEPAAILIDRRCDRCGEPHGRPTVPDHDVHVSVTHSGGLVGVALTRAGPVGLDVETLERVNIRSVATEFLAAADDRLSTRDLIRCWTRKESVAKATGDGIAVGMRGIEVSHPRLPPVLLGYPDRPILTAVMTDLSPPGSFVGCVAVLTDGTMRLLERREDGPPDRSRDAKRFRLSDDL
jgi:4'-phosphopantetheinyl transferase